MRDVMDRLKATNERLREEYKAEKVILFGYYARGEATKDSDADVLVITPTSERFFEGTCSFSYCFETRRSG
jgi:predicted nucleotidyltransferase